MQTVDAYIDDFVQLKVTQMKHQVNAMFRERTSLTKHDIVPSLLLTQTLQKIESCIGQGCDEIRFQILLAQSRAQIMPPEQQAALEAQITRAFDFFVQNTQRFF